jgi:serine/threonine protein kinase
LKAFFSKLIGGKSPIGRREKARRIGDYTVVRKIGSGGTSDVYLALHVETLATVAIKQLSLKRSASSHQEMFATEARLCGLLDHPNIVSMYSADLEEPAGAYLVMEYIDGDSLDKHDLPDALLPIEKVMNVMRQAAEALSHLAGEGIIHRDIKPGNIILRKDGRVKIADFGCAILDRQPPSSLRVAGSLPFMAPEQIAGMDLGHHSDMYSLGAVFYRLLTGHHPIAMDEGEEPAVYARRILRSQYAPIEQYRQDVPVAIADIVGRMLRKKPEDRYESWSLFLHELYRASIEKYPEDEELNVHWKSFEIRREERNTHDYNLSFGF